MNRIDRIVKMISILRVDDLKELNEKLGNIGGLPLGIHAKITPKIKPPTLNNYNFADSEVEKKEAL